MANKKVSQLTSKPSVLVTDLFPIADPSTGQLYKTTISDLGTAIGSGVSSVNGLVGAVVLDTDDIQELVSPTNKWFTDTRARAAISAGTGISYNSGTGVITNAVTSGQIAIALGYTPANPANVVPYTGATGAVNLGAFNLTVNTLTVGIGSGNISTNTVLGYEALLANTTGYSNVAIGWRSLKANTIGNNNTAIGESAMISAISGDNNTAIGGFVLNSLTTGSSNTIMGQNSGSTITTGSLNTIIGAVNTSGITTGSFNTILGAQISGLSTSLANNIIIADGQGNIKYRWDGTTNNLFGSTTLSSTLNGTNAIFTSTLKNKTSLEITSTSTSAVTSSIFLGTNASGLYGSSIKVNSNYAVSNSTDLIFQVSNAGTTVTAANFSNLGAFTLGSISGQGTGSFFAATATIGNFTPIADALLPVQINAVATTGQAYFAANNGGTYGLLIGYDNVNGIARIRNVSNTSLTFETSNTEQMRIISNGNINLNSTVYGNTATAVARILYIGSDYRIGGLASVRKSKKNIENISNVDWIYNLNPVTFNYRKKDADEKFTEDVYDELVYGLIAEDTQPIADFLVNYNDKNEMVGIEYMRLITPMLKAIQDLKQEINYLKN